MQFFRIYINNEEGRGFFRNTSVKSKYKLKCVVYLLKICLSLLFLSRRRPNTTWYNKEFGQSYSARETHQSSFVILRVEDEVDKTFKKRLVS